MRAMATIHDKGSTIWHAGASLVELWTSMAYEGPALVPRLKRELAECLERDGFKSVQEAVGADLPEEEVKSWWRSWF